jgi:hypothetical protein
MSMPACNQATSGMSVPACNQATSGMSITDQATTGLAVSERPFSDLPAFDLPASILATSDRLPAGLAGSGLAALSGDFLLCLGGDRKDVRARPPDCGEERRHLFQDFISGEG